MVKPCKSQFYKATIWGWFWHILTTVQYSDSGDGLWCLWHWVYHMIHWGGTLQHLQAVSNRRSPGRRSWTSEVSWEIFCFFRHFNIYKTASWMVLHGSSTRFCSHLVRILNFDLWLHLNVGQDLARIWPGFCPLSQRGSKSWDHPTFRWMICYLSWNVGTLKSCFTLPKEGAYLKMRHDQQAGLVSERGI